MSHKYLIQQFLNDLMETMRGKKLLELRPRKFILYIYKYQSDPVF
jgi:hypothetical protein